MWQIKGRMEEEMVESMMTQEFGELNVKENFLEVVFFLIELLGKSLKFFFFFTQLFFKQHFIVTRPVKHQKIPKNILQTLGL